MKYLLPFLVLLASPALSAPAQMPVVCDDRRLMIGALRDEHSEMVRWQGISKAKDGDLLIAELWYSTDTWTILLTPARNDATTCMIAHGQGDSIFNKPKIKSH